MIIADPLDDGTTAESVPVGMPVATEVMVVAETACVRVLRWAGP
jgi:hypothetical protein